MRHKRVRRYNLKGTEAVRFEYVGSGPYLEGQDERLMEHDRLTLQGLCGHFCFLRQRVPGEFGPCEAEVGEGEYTLVCLNPTTIPGDRARLAIGRADAEKAMAAGVPWIPFPVREED